MVAEGEQGRRPCWVVAGAARWREARGLVLARQAVEEGRVLANVIEVFFCREGEWRMSLGWGFLVVDGCARERWREA